MILLYIPIQRRLRHPHHLTNLINGILLTFVEDSAPFAVSLG